MPELTPGAWCWSEEHRRPCHIIEVQARAAAARVADALAEDILIAPLLASVIPLPHQIRALRRATQGDHVRHLLADEVGLGKTIEAGLIIGELKARGRVKRVLVIAPKGLVTQWVLHTAAGPRQRETHEYALAARRRALERVGLPAVRAHRLRQLEAEEDQQVIAAALPGTTLRFIIEVQRPHRPAQRP